MNFCPFYKGEPLKRAKRGRKRRQAQRAVRRCRPQNRTKYFRQLEKISPRVYEAFMEKINNPVFIEFKNKLNMLTAKWDTLCKELEDETL